MITNESKWICQLIRTGLYLFEVKKRLIAIKSVTLNPTPLKPFEYLYFNIYNHCYQRSYQSGELLSRFQAMYLLSFSAGGWLLFLQAMYLRTIKHSWFTTKDGAMLFALTVYLVTAMIFHRIFIVNEKDQQIMSKYEASWNNNPNKKRDLLLSVVMIAAPYLLLGSMSLLFPRNQ